jgi:hypothetical protein
MAREGDNNETIAKNLGISVVRVKVQLNYAEYNLIFTNRSLAEVRRDFPNLSYQAHRSPYWGIPAESLQLCVSKWMSLDPK